MALSPTQSFFPTQGHTKHKKVNLILNHHHMELYLHGFMLQW